MLINQNNDETLLQIKKRNLIDKFKPKLNKTWAVHTQMEIQVVSGGRQRQILDTQMEINIYIYIYIYRRGSLNKFPDIFRMDTFIDSTHMKL